MNGSARGSLSVAALVRFLGITVLGIAAGAAGSARAQTSPSSSSAGQVKKSSSGTDSKLDSGTVSAGVYRNPAFGFTCKIPAGWVLRTEEMNSRESESAGAAKTAADSVKAGRVLLAAFSRPPEARAEDVNASILIAAESAASYPGLKDAAQYFGPVTEVAKAQGLEVVEEPYEFVMGTKTVVRGDFKKDVGSRVMRQSTLVVLARGYAVSFTFIGGSEDEVEELARGLSFGAAKTAR
jgi:hypothetical protein